MSVPFSERVSSPEWLDEAATWIGERAGESGRRLTGPVTQRRVRPWSTQLVAPTDDGPLWFKANAAPMAFEPALHELLAELLPADVDAPVAIDADRGWILTADRGQTLGDDHQPTLGDWCSAVTIAARLQRAVADHRHQVLGTGVVDCSPATVPDRFDELLDQLRALRSDHPSHVDSATAATLVETRPRIEAAADRLAASPLPCSIQHGDLHPWNVFATPDGLRVFDFGDAQWASPVEMMFVPQAVIEHDGGLDWDSVFDAYGDEWTDVIAADDLRALYDAAAFTQAVNRAQTWYDIDVDLTDDESAEWGDAPRHHLLRVLDATSSA